MSELMDKPIENPDEDRVSLKSNGKTPTKDAVKGTLNKLQSFRKSVKRAVEKSPLSSVGKGSKVTSKADSDGNDLGSPHSSAPSSPSE